MAFANEIGVIVRLEPRGGTLARVREFGLNVCQVVCWEQDLLTPTRAVALRKEAEKEGVKVTSLWAGWPGPRIWNLIDGPRTLGLVPSEYRMVRIGALKRAGEFAKEAGLPAIVTHVGFVPENPNDSVFQEVVEAVRDVAESLGRLELGFWFETGQETPVTLLRLIRAVGTENLGVNLDPANLIMYGKGNPVDALDVVGSYVKSIHAKDALYPTDPLQLGKEVKVGTGRVRFPELVQRLRQIGYEGPFIIEREITGEQQRLDIIETVEYLRNLLSRAGEAV
ncbi:MAG: sugar phosphate isomerase/epimerase [Kiritimatiellae bacterium]|nr:sugar phosphate isomerase/epimerase [Kiritimatiellia bacterium]